MTSECTFDFGARPSARRPIVSYDEVAHASAEAWRKRWQTDIVLDGPAEDQQAIHSFLFYLRSAIAPDGTMSLAPFGLSNSIYNGHVFWDADMWVFPALAFIDPATAAAIPQYRIRMMAAARQNFAGLRKPGDGLRFPWESSTSGRETGHGPSMDEVHVSGDVAWSAALAAALGLETPAQANAILEGVRGYYAAIGEGPPQGRTLGHVLSADEYWYVDNDLYTNVLAQWIANDGTWGTKTKYRLPADAETFLTYDNDLVRAYKQSAAVLAIYPLQYPPAERQGARMMARFEPKVSPNGPAMSKSIDAVIWAREGDAARAYEAWRASWRPYTRLPLMLFSEKTVRADTYFTTGAAGALQDVLNGFLGFRIDYTKEPGAAWSTPLRDGKRWLSIKPNLPRQWKSVTFKNFSVLGRRYTLSATPAHVSVTHEP